MNELQAVDSKITMTSLEVVELINKFRLEEGNRTNLTHNNFLKSIRRELEILKNAGITGRVNFYESEYTNLQNKKQPCYNMNKAGIMMMLNKESTLVRYKTQQYIEALENKITELNNQQQLKASLLLSIYNGGQEGVVASKQLVELETKPLIDKIEEDKPKVALADTRLDKGKCISITDVTKSLKFKRGQITKWAKYQGYLHKTKTEVNKKGENYFKIYETNGFKCIGITEEGLKLINHNSQEIKNI